MNDVFELDPRLARDCETISEFQLCLVLLMKDSNYPWFILVPKVFNAVEIVELTGNQQQQLLTESNIVSRFILDYFKAEKLNVAALGNVVKQLHIHHLGRFESDAAWPNPVWNACAAKPYPAEQISDIRRAFEHYID